MAKIQPVRGTHDLHGEELKRHRHIIETARLHARCYSFEEWQTPIFEFTSVFHRSLGDTSDIVSKEMYTFEDKGGDKITLRPEGTAPIARAFISEGLAQSIPVKLFYQGPMFRYERPQKGRLRQFHQFGVELIGAESTQADIEVISLAQTILYKLGLNSQVRLEINTIGDSESRQIYRQKLVDYFTPYAGELSEDSQRRLRNNPLRILDSKDEKEQKIIAEAPLFSDHLNASSKTLFDEVQNGLNLLGIQYLINPRLVRGLDYYNHCVFEFRTNAIGAQDTVISGGRYDSLIKTMGGPPTPGVGFAAGIERLSLMLDRIDQNCRPVAIIPLGDSANDQAMKLAYGWRKQGWFIDMSYSGNSSKRMKKASKVNSRYAVLIGDDEIKNHTATLKDLDNGQQETLSLENLQIRLKEYFDLTK